VFGKALGKFVFDVRKDIDVPAVLGVLCFRWLVRWPLQQLH